MSAVASLMPGHSVYNCTDCADQFFICMKNLFVSMFLQFKNSLVCKVLKELRKPWDKKTEFSNI